MLDKVIYRIAGALALAATVAGKAYPHTLTLLDHSPLLHYTPLPAGVPGNASSSPAEAWNQSYTGNAWAEYAPNTLGSGSSYTSTSVAGASVWIAWIGTGISFSGSFGGSGGAVELRVDGGKTRPGTGTSNSLTGNLLVDSGPLNDGLHNATLSVKSGTISISSVNVTYGLMEDPADAYEYIDYAIEDAATGGLVQNPKVSYDGSWAVNGWIGGVAGSDQVAYARYGCNQEFNRSSIEIDVGHTFVELQGTTSYDHGYYTIQLRPPAPGDETTKFTYSGMRPFVSPNSTLFAAALDPSVAYTLSVVVGDPGVAGGWLDLSTAKLLKAAPRSSSGSKAPIGAIVGGVVGGVAVLLLVAIALWFVRRRRRRAHRNKTGSASPTTFEIDETPALKVTEPYVTPSPSHYMSAPTAEAGSSHRSTSHAGSGSASGAGMLGLGYTSPTASSATSGAAGYDKALLTSALARPPIPAPTITQEADGGLVMDEHHSESDNVFVPPRYDPDWGTAAEARREAAQARSQSQAQSPGSPSGIDFSRKA